MFGRTFERIGLVAFGAVASASVLTLANGGSSSPPPSQVAAGLVAPGVVGDAQSGEAAEAFPPSNPEASGSQSKDSGSNDSGSNDSGSASDIRPSKPPIELAVPVGGDVAESAPAEASTGDQVGSAEGDQPSAEIGSPFEPRVASAAIGVAGVLAVELAPANQLFGTTTSLAPATTTTAAPAPAVTTTTVVRPRLNGRTVEGAEWRLLNGINAKRNRSGVNGISMNEVARVEARRWSKEMAERNYFDHRPDITSGVDWTNAIGENVATGGQITAIDIGLWNSLSHRDNILSTNFSEVGIGVWFDGRTGQFWVTEIFIG